jgi:DNA anti-recombination protein RmuC
MTFALLIALMVAGGLAAFFAVRASRLDGDLERAVGERDSVAAEREELAGMPALLAESEQRLAAANARLEAIEAERDRLLVTEEDKLSQTHKHVGDLRRDLDEIKQQKLPQLLDNSSKAASGAERVEASMITWTRRIANPQSRGAFGELAVENQLQSLGLERGRDYMRQVAGDDGKLRPDFVIRAGDASVIVDAKFALDEDLAGIDEALDSENEERLVAYGRKLRARAEELAKRDYAKVAEKGRPIVFFYVPVEGAYEALRILPNFSIEKFAQRHRVYMVTPSQLGLALGFVAQVAHEARRGEETEQVAMALNDAAEDLVAMFDQVDQHGRHLQTAFKSYDKLVGMTGSRGKLWRHASRVFDFARRLPENHGEVRELDPPRTDAGEIAERWREAADG